VVARFPEIQDLIGAPLLRVIYTTLPTGGQLALGFQSWGYHGGTARHAPRALQPAQGGPPPPAPPRRWPVAAFPRRRRALATRDSDDAPLSPPPLAPPLALSPSPPPLVVPPLVMGSDADLVALVEAEGLPQALHTPYPRGDPTRGVFCSRTLNLGSIQVITQPLLQ
jgi:hypothetical protein